MAKPDFAKKVAQASALTEEQQKKAGMPVKAPIDPKYTSFLEGLVRLIESKEIDPYDPKSFLKMEIYDALDEVWKDKTDLALLNIGNQVRIIYEYWISKNTPNDAPQLATMVEQLWEMKQRIEQFHDCFKF